MTLKIFTVYDSKAEAYMQPFFMKTKGEAMRAFADSCKDPKTQFNKHPEDFTLFEIGEYEEQSAQIHNHTVNISLGNALEFADHKQTQFNGHATQELNQ